MSEPVGVDGDSPVDFEPVPVRARHDGWDPGRQQDFIEALAESACVREACDRVGMSTRSAYALRSRPESQSFRAAWDSALDYAMNRLADAAVGRALNGVEVPHFYKGELVGTHRRYDERLAMWLLRYRQPERYGKWMDSMKATRAPDGAAVELFMRSSAALVAALREEDEAAERAGGCPSVAPEGDASPGDVA